MFKIDGLSEESKRLGERGYCRWEDMFSVDVDLCVR